MRRLVAGLLVGMLVAPGGVMRGEESVQVLPLEPLFEGPPVGRIVNGLNTQGFPSVVALLLAGARTEFCSGTFVGCRTVLTAAHCVCDSVGTDCQSGGAALRDPSTIQVFAQHGGLFGVAGINVPATYDFSVGSDLALLQLEVPVDGVAPTAINTLQSPGSGLAGFISGFGLSAGGAADNGIKRFGQITTTACTVVPDTTHVCWTFEEPVGDPGDDSNTCSGDSGGPLFIDFGSGFVVAGVTSGGISFDCLPSDEAFDTDVFVDRTWLQSEGGADLEKTTCGGLPQAGSPEAPILGGEGNLSASNPDDVWTLEVPAGTRLLRFTLNGADGLFNDFDLYVNLGSQPSGSDYDCGSFLSGNYEVCDIDSPAPGTWYILVDRFFGAGEYQVQVTVFAESPPLFSDGFESGDTSAWSNAVP